MRKKIDLRLVRPSHRYSVRELADTLGVTIQAIYWDIHKDNLPCFTTSSGWKIWGREFIEFTKERRNKGKTKCIKGMFKCFKCRKHSMPENNEVEVNTSRLSENQIENGTIMLIGRCPNCGHLMYQLSNISRLHELELLYNLKEEGELL